MDNSIKVLSVSDYINMCKPIKDQGEYIDSIDVEYLIPILRDLKPKIILEIGAKFGTSSRLFGGIAREFDGKLYSIEPVPKSAWYDNMLQYELLEFVELIPKASPWITWDETKQIDFLFIDGYHIFRAVLVDYFYWIKFVRDGGLIAFHDANKDDVKRAIKEILNTEINKFEGLEFIGKSNSNIGIEIYKKLRGKRGISN